VADLVILDVVDNFMVDGEAFILDQDYTLSNDDMLGVTMSTDQKPLCIGITEVSKASET
jgi:hypothetical protein